MGSIHIFVKLLVLVSGAFVGVFLEPGVFFFHFDPSPGWPERTRAFCFSLLSRLSHVPWLCDCSEGMWKEKKNQIKTAVMVTRRQVFKQRKRKRAKTSPKQPAQTALSSFRFAACWKRKASPNF